jgi:hypothetical protein
MHEIEDLVSLVQQKLSRLKRDNHPVTREDIVAAVDRAFEWEPSWKTTVDRDLALRILVERNSVWIGEEKVLEGNDDHVAWLNATVKTGWRYWPRYRLLLGSRMADTTIDSLDRVTDRTLGLLENPARDGAWDRRGLIVGHVQSGKTSNYAGLICKAADAGYKIIIVLAGMHKNLRSQTQMRLDEGFLGYETSPSREEQPRHIGVGLLDPDQSIRPNYVTNRADNGDFSTKVAQHLGITPDQRPWLFVVKKHKTVLTRLLEWIENRVADITEQASGKKMVTRLPLLLIDDEADNASVDTGQQAFDAEGKPDPEHEPKAINSLIRRILRAFSRSAFVGYTATPFANIFIHERGRTDEEGDDLFPRSFIINLPGPSNYAGPVRIFGAGTRDSGDDGDAEGGLPLIREIDDFADSDDEDEREGWMPLRHPNGHMPLVHGEDTIPDSLKEAVLSFVTGCAVRQLRRQGQEHCSMLIHVTRYNSVQDEVCRQVNTFLLEVRQRLRRGIGAQEILQQCEELWRTDFVPTTTHINAVSSPDEQVELLSWESVRAILADVAEDIHVRTINGTAGDVLDYSAHQGAGLKVIAIGGDKLARGLTLEGLTVSYFLRASKMYDTLMQMGRWFGYRHGYLDMCRLYTTGELESWFRHITEASEELREEFDHMVSIGGTPKDYGLRVRSHPVLMVTSRVKMRTARKLSLSYSGELVETTVLHRDRAVLERNLAATSRLVEGLDAPERDPEQARPDGKCATWAGSLLWRDVAAEHVISFLGGYGTHEGAYKVNSQMLTEFIDKMSRQGELTSWTVAVLAGRSETPVNLGGLSVKAVERAPDGRAENQERDGRYVIRRLLSPRDEAIDLDLDAWAAALEQTRRAWASDPARGGRKNADEITDPNGPAIRYIRGRGHPETRVLPHPERGLLLIYPLDPKTAGLDHAVPVIAAGVSFPATTLRTKVEYAVNNVYWDQEYGGGGNE